MGNCAGCAAPQRTYRVQRLQQNSPIKNRLSNGKSYFPTSNSNAKQFSFHQKDKIAQRGSFNQNDVFSNIIGMTQSKSRPTNNFNQPHFNQFTSNALSQVVRTHIKLYPDNPQNLRQTNKKLQRSYLYQNENQMYNSKLDFQRKQSSGGAYSNQLLKSIQSQSKKYLHQSGTYQRSPLRNTQQNWNMSQPKNYTRSPRNNYNQQNMLRFDDISQIRTQKISRNNYQHQNSLPLKKYNRYNKDLTVIQQILQQDHKTPIDIRLQRKKNGQDIIYDGFQGLPDQLQPLQIPNLQPYLSTLKLVTQKN